jgi:hypothetical protein
MALENRPDENIDYYINADEGDALVNGHTNTNQKAVQ